MTQCRTWWIPENYFNPQCSMEFRPVLGQDSCPVCVNPLETPVSGSSSVCSGDSLWEWDDFGMTWMLINDSCEAPCSPTEPGFSGTPGQIAPGGCTS